MKLTHVKRQHPRPELMMTSMIDVVFLLLIYFMTTTTTWRPEKEMSSTIHTEQTSARAASEDLRPLVIDVVPGKSGFVWRIGAREIADSAQLRKIIEQYPNKISGAFVRVSDAVPYGMAATAIHLCRQAQYSPVAYVPIEEP